MVLVTHNSTQALSTPGHTAGCSYKAGCPRRWGGIERYEGRGRRTRRLNIAWIACSTYPLQAVEGQGISLKSDVYSFGIIFWELLTGQIPYDGKMIFETLKLIVEGKVLILELIDNVQNWAFFSSFFSIQKFQVIVQKTGINFCRSAGLWTQRYIYTVHTATLI